MKATNLFAITTLLAIAVSAEATDVDDETNTSTSSQQTSGKPGDSSAFGCNPFPECERDINSIWLDLFIQQFKSQSRSDNEDRAH